MNKQLNEFAIAKAKRIDDNMYLYIHKRKWWLPVFIYNAVIKKHTTLIYKQK